MRRDKNESFFLPNSRGGNCRDGGTIKKAEIPIAVESLNYRDLGLNLLVQGFRASNEYSD